MQPQNSEKELNAPGKARKRRNRVRSGCWRGVQPVRTGGETRNPNQNAPDSNATHEKRKPAKTQCFRRFFGRGRRTCLGCRLGRFAAERHWRSLTPRHALRRAQPCLVAKTFRPVTKNSATAKAVAPFLAGAEGLEPSARGFGVDVGERTRERGRVGVARFPRQVRNRVVLLWCCGENRNGDGRKVSNFRNYCAIRQDLI